MNQTNTHRSEQEEVDSSVAAMQDIQVLVSVVQTRNHQAAEVGAEKFYSEPYVDTKELPLSKLAAMGLSVDGLLRECRQEYKTWSETRLVGILESLKNEYIEFAISNRYDLFLVVFPEYAIHFSELVLVKRWVEDLRVSLQKEYDILKKHDASPPSVACFAGTHTLPERSIENDQIYHTLGIEESELDVAYENDLSVRSAAVVLLGENENLVRGRLLPKTVLSPFELTNTSKHVSTKIDATELKIVNVAIDLKRHLRVCCFICAEALQLKATVDAAEFDIAIIPSYSQSPPFDSLIDQLTKNRRLTVFANDGLFGGTGIFLPPTKERGESWWLNKPNYGKMPPGDSMLVAEISLRHITDVTHVNSHFERCRLIRLASIVPFNKHEQSYFAALCLRKVLSIFQEEKTIDQPAKDLCRNVLADCQELLAITELQKRKIKRLLSFDTLSDEYFNFYCRDIVVSEFFDQANKSIDFSGANDSLEHLERQLSQKCLKRLKSMAESEKCDIEQYKALREVTNEMEERSQVRQDRTEYSTQNLVNSAWKFIVGERNSSVQSAKARIKKLTAEIAARYKATYAFVVANVPEFRLTRSLETFKNASPLWLVSQYRAKAPELCPKTGSMVSVCVDKGEPVCYPEIRQVGGVASVTDFIPICVDTKSAIAVPILLPSEAKEHEPVLGALVLESSNPAFFSASDTVELQNEVGRLASPLTFLRNLQAEPMSLLHFYYPGRQDHREVLDRFLDFLAERLRPYSGPAGIDITIWQKESESNNGIAVSSTGYDMEYTSQKVMRELTTHHKSFIGQVLEGIPDYKSIRWFESRDFRDSAKAKRNKLNRLFAVSVNVVDPFTEVSQADQVQTSLAIVFLTFLDTNRAVEPHLGEDPLNRLSDIFGRFIESLMRQVSVDTVADLHAAVVALALDSSSAFELARDLIARPGNIDGCSIFTVNQEQMMFVETTSGLSNSTTAITVRPGIAKKPIPFYRDWETLRNRRDTLSILSSIGEQESMFICKNVDATPYRSRPARERLMESFTLFENAHRKTLVIGISTPDNNKFRNTGVIRLARSTHSRHFDIFDIARVRFIAKYLVDVVDLAGFSRTKLVAAVDSKKTPSTARLIASFEKNDSSHFLNEIRYAENGEELSEAELEEVKKEASSFNEGRDDQITKCFKRIFNPVLSFSSWSESRVNESLRDLFVATDLHCSTLVMLRWVEQGLSLSRRLSIKHFRTNSNFQIAEEAAGESIEESSGGIGWNSIKSRCLVIGLRDSEYYTLMFPEAQKESYAAICLPFTLPFPALKMTQRAVLSTEWKDKVAPNRFDVLSTVATAWRLSWLSMGNGVDSLENRKLVEQRIGKTSCSLLEDCQQEFDAFLNQSSFAINIVVSDGKSEEVFTNGVSDSELKKAQKWFRRLKIDRVKQIGLNSGVPEKIAEFIVDRRGFTYLEDSREIGDSRQFGRLSTENWERIRELSSLDCAVDFKKGWLVVPLRFAGVQFGACFASVAMNTSREQRLARMCSIASSVSAIWFKYVSPKLYTWEDFGIRKKLEHTEGGQEHYSLEFDRTASETFLSD